MSELLYNGVSLPIIPAHDASYGVEVIVEVLPSAQSMYGGAPYILAIGKRVLWQNGKCYVGGIYAVYRLSGDAWVWHYGSGTVSTQDIVAANYFEALWTNTDIPNANGVGIYLAATEPVDPNAPEEPDVPVEPDEPEEPEEPTVTTAQLRRAFSNGFILGMQMRGMLKKRVVEEPDEPVEGDWVLYGTPSENGNLAVADGDGYVRYKGYVLPPLPVVDTAEYPYAFVRDVGTAWPQYQAVKDFSIEPVTDEHDYRLKAGEHIGTYININEGESMQWSYLRITDVMDVRVPTVVWTNTNITYEGTVLVPKTEPVPLASFKPIRYEGNIPVYERKRSD